MKAILGRDCRSLNTFPNSYEILSVHQFISTLVYDIPTFPRSHMTCLLFVLCLLLSNPHRSPIRWLTILTSLSSHDTSSIKSITLPPSSPFSTLKTFYISKSSTRGVVFLISIWCSLLLIIALSHFLLYCAKLVLVILSAGEIMSLYSRYAEKGLVYIIITSPTNC